MINRFRVTIIFLIIFYSSIAGNINAGNKVQVEILSRNENFSVIQNKIFIAIKFTITPGWHIYWKNPGDSGIPPKIKWNLPKGFNYGEIQWPAPERIEVAGLVNYGFHDEIYLVTNLSAPPGFSGEINIESKIEWLVCREGCIPEDTTLTFTLSSEKSVGYNKKWNDVENFLSHHATDFLNEKSVTASATDSSVIITGLPGLIDSGFYFFPSVPGIFDNLRKPLLSENDQQNTLEIFYDQYYSGKPEKIAGLFLSGNKNSEKFAINIPLNEEIKNETASFYLLVIILLSAFAGGLILNIMPCVLPVLSLKVFSILKGGQSTKSEIFSRTLYYTLGILTAFWILTTLMLLLKSGGEQIGWGFQLQYPQFVIMLIFFFFVFALNLLGLFEAGASFTRISADKKGKSHKAESFLSGLLAVVVATPCTAPFMGTALGFTLTQPAWITALVFTFLGLGLASPFMLFVLFPSLTRYMPKPGNWMELFKNLMGFLLLATIIWLIWVLEKQTGGETLTYLFAGLLITSLGAWIAGKWNQPVKARITRWTAISIFTLLIVSGVMITIHGMNNQSVNETAKKSEDGWNRFKQQKIDGLINKKEKIFIDFTAAWCLSCQVNKKTALTGDEIDNFFQENEIHLFRADWTKRDTEITRALASYNRNSVPLYVYLTPENNYKPVILPEILTKEIVTDYILNKGK